MKLKNTNGYSILELLLFVAAIGGFIAFMVPQTIELKKDTRERLKQRVLSKLESAKNVYDTTANKDSRTKFDGSNDETRFEQLAPLMEATDPITFVKGTGIHRLKINRLGENV